MAKQYESRKNAQKTRSTMKFTGYPNRRSFAIFVAHCYTIKMKKATLVKKVMDEYLSKIPASKQAELLEIFNKLTPEQKKYAGRFEEEGD